MSVNSCIFMWQTWPKGCEKRRRVGHLKIVNYANLTKNARIYMGVSKNKGAPKSLILIGFSIINHPFWGTPTFGNTYIDLRKLTRKFKSEIP